jgi:hypothetical protein
MGVPSIGMNAFAPDLPHFAARRNQISAAAHKRPRGRKIAFTSGAARLRFWLDQAAPIEPIKLIAV